MGSWGTHEIMNIKLGLLDVPEIKSPNFLIFKYNSAVKNQLNELFYLR